MRVVTSFLLLIFLSFQSVLVAEESYENMRIQKLQILIGKDTHPEQLVSIRARMKTKEGSLFSQSDFDEDLKVLAREYDRVEPVFEIVDQKLEITLQLHSKPRIDSIKFQGNRAISTDRLSKELGIMPCSIFDRSQFNKAFHRLKNYYVKRGYFEAELDYTVKHHPDSDNVDIQILINEGRSGHINRIIIHGADKCECCEILELINTKEYSIWSSWFTNEGIHKTEILRQDELQILNYFHNQGYADAKIEIKIEQAKQCDKINIVIHVAKGGRYNFGAISFSGNKVYSDETLACMVCFKDGDIYSPEKIRQSSQAISDAYGRKGYVDVVVIPDTKLDSRKRIYAVSFEVQEGKRYRVGLIKVFGNYQTQARVILNESLLTPGEIFDTTLMSKTEERLRNVGYFTSVHVYAVKSKEESVISDEAGFRDVHIDVEEKATTANFKASVGYSMTERLVGSIGFADYNFNYCGITQVCKRGLRAMRGGGEYLGFDATFGRKIMSYTLGWSKPYFCDSLWTVGFDLNKLRNSYAANDYTIKSYTATVFGNYQFNAFLRMGLHYRLRHSFVHLEGIRHTRRNRELIRESHNGGLISGVGFDFVYNSTDNPIRPTTGLKSTIAFDYAGLGGDHKFAKISYLNTLYYCPYDGGVLRLRGNVQFIKTFGSTHPRDLPLDERLYTGGEMSIRGYLYNRVGPKFHDRRHTPRGGMSEVLLSAEFDQYIMKRIDAFVFIDAGNVYFEQFHLGGLRATAGYGVKVRIRENAAPLSIGMGYALNPTNERDLRRFFLSFGTTF